MYYCCVGGTQRLPRLVGPAVAKELLFTADVLVAEEALRVGLVEHMVTQTEEGHAAYNKAIHIASSIIDNVSICAVDHLCNAF